MKSHLHVRLDELTDGERERLIAKLSIDRATYYRRLAGQTPWKWDEINAVKHFLDKLDGKDYDMTAMARPVRMPVRKVKSAALAVGIRRGRKAQRA